MASLTLTNTQIRYLRGLAHKMKPIVLVGQAGASVAVARELDAALEHHELLKMKIHGAVRDDVLNVASALAEQTASTLVQRIGHTIVLYRAAKKPKLLLPR